MKTDKNFWKKLSRTFNDWALQDSYRSERSIKLSHTALWANHSVGRGPNPGEPGLLDFSTRIMEASTIYFHYEAKYGSIEIYVNSKTKSANQTFFEIRRNGKNRDFVFQRHADVEDYAWFIKDLLKEAQQKIFYDASEVRETLLKLGYSIIAEFDFTDRVEFELPHHSRGFIRPKYVKATKTSIEIGWVSSGTYNSLPNVVRIEKCRGVKTRSLSKLGIETKGYYSHHYHCNILPEQATQARRFFNSRFKGAAS